MAKVMVVDDEPEIRLLFERALQGEGYEVVTADDGNRALSLMDEHEIELVITDIHMPAMHGIELCYHMLQKSPHLPIIAVSGGGNVGDPMRAKQGLDSAEMEGAIAVFFKPVKLELLMTKVNELLSE